MPWFIEAVLSCISVTRTELAKHPRLHNWAMQMRRRAEMTSRQQTVDKTLQGLFRLTLLARCHQNYRRHTTSTKKRHRPDLQASRRSLQAAARARTHPPTSPLAAPPPRPTASPQPTAPLRLVSPLCHYHVCPLPRHCPCLPPTRQAPETGTHCVLPAPAFVPVHSVSGFPCPAPPATSRPSRLACYGE